MSKARARKIKLLLFDVDGVMTDGKLWVFPAADHPKGFIEPKGFHAHDGIGMSLARMGGLKTGLITKRMSESVALRARDLRIDYVYQGIDVKIEVFEKILGKEKIGAAEVAYMGDDIIDLPIMRRCGFAVAVANARDEVKNEAHWVTPHAGGEGAVRDAVEYILGAQGRWRSVLEEYLQRGDTTKVTT